MAKIVIISVFIAGCLILPIAADAQTAQIKIAWDANSEPDLLGYRVYVGTKTRAYGTPIDVGNVTTYTLSGLIAGQTYYIGVTAYDNAGNESGFSKEISGMSTGVTNTAKYVPGDLRVFVQRDLPDTLGFAWNSNPDDVGYYLYLYNSLSGAPTVNDVGNVTFRAVPTLGNYFIMARVEAYYVNGGHSAMSDSTEWLDGNVAGDYRTGVSPQNIRVFTDDLFAMSPVFGSAVVHCLTPSNATASTCPAPSSLQLMDRDGDGIFGPFDIIDFGVSDCWGKVPPP